MPVDPAAIEDHLRFCQMFLSLSIFQQQAPRLTIPAPADLHHAHPELQAVSQ
jgi:hypothetical protein